VSGARLCAIVFAVGALTLGGVSVFGDGVAWVAVPVLVLGSLYGIWRLPLRYPTLALTFLALTLESPSDAPSAGLWVSPLATTGAIFLAHLNLTLPYKWLFFSGLDIALVCLFAVALARRAGTSRSPSVASAAPMRRAVILALAAAGWMWVWGMVRGDADVASSLWQLQRVIYVPLVFLLFLLAFRGARDAPALGGVIVAAACIKAGLAIFIRATLQPPPGETTISYATTHPDSMLFAGAFCLVVALLLQRVGRRRTLLAAVVLPLLLAGMVANHRRVVWVELAAGLATVALLTPSTPLRRALARTAVLASPVALVYLVAGWGSTASIFAPVEVVRSVVDSQADASTAWRDWENYNLFFTLREAPILGSGYGHGYIEKVRLPDISQAYALYRFIPHNSILGLWAYGGLVGFTALWAMLVVGVFFAVRTATHATTALDRATACSAAASVVVYLVHCYGDMGLGTWTSVFTVAPALAIAGQLAVSTRAWPASRRQPGGSPVRTRPAEDAAFARSGSRS
jgi:hypothetical protein